MPHELAGVITADQITGMVEHWLATPENGYLGSSYGGKTIVQNHVLDECTDTAKNMVLSKLVADISILCGASIEWQRPLEGAVVFTISSPTYKASFLIG